MGIEKNMAPMLDGMQERGAYIKEAPAPMLDGMQERGAYIKEAPVPQKESKSFLFRAKNTLKNAVKSTKTKVALAFLGGALTVGTLGNIDFSKAEQSMQNDFTGKELMEMLIAKGRLHDVYSADGHISDHEYVAIGEQKATFDQNFLNSNNISAKEFMDFAEIQPHLTIQHKGITPEAFAECMKNLSYLDNNVAHPVISESFKNLKNLNLEELKLIGKTAYDIGFGGLSYDIDKRILKGQYER
ncbi:MAG: hypothetical protein FWE47_04560, partial [Oscillospiraceae bacterium]|nr:hypothetical protein [Oscillospiraceae bacterium]